MIGRALSALRGMFASEEVATLAVSATTEVALYDRPGRNLADSDLEDLQNQLFRLRDKAGMGALQQGIFVRDRMPYTSRIIAVSRDRRTRQVTGFSTTIELELPRGHEPPLRLLILDLVIVDPACRRQGLGGLLHLLGAVYAQGRTAPGLTPASVWCASVSQVPALLGMTAEHLDEVVPRPGQPLSPTAEHREIARALLATRPYELGVSPTARFDEDRFVLEDSFEPAMRPLATTFETAPAHRDQAVNDACRTTLDYGRGDRFVQLGTMSTAAASTWLQKRIPVALRPALVAQFKTWHKVRQPPSWARRD